MVILIRAVRKEYSSLKVRFKISLSTASLIETILYWNKEFLKHNLHRSQKKHDMCIQAYRILVDNIVARLNIQKFSLLGANYLRICD